MSTPFSTMRAARRTFVLAALSAAAMGFGGVQAADYPSSPIRLVGFTAGSGTDLIARVISAGLQDSLKTSVVVENLPRRIGPDRGVCRSKSQARWLHPFLYHQHHTGGQRLAVQIAPLRPHQGLCPHHADQRDAVPALGAQRHAGCKDVKELVAWLKANPSQASYGYGNSTARYLVRP